MSHAGKADKLLIKPTAGARPASPCTPGRFIRKARTNGLTPDESQAARTTPTLATAPDGPTQRLSQTPERINRALRGKSRGRDYVQM
jgi:hypothetical protein